MPDTQTAEKWTVILTSRTVFRQGVGKTGKPYTIYNYKGTDLEGNELPEYISSFDALPLQKEIEVEATEATRERKSDKSTYVTWSLHGEGINIEDEEAAWRQNVEERLAALENGEEF